VYGQFIKKNVIVILYAHSKFNSVIKFMLLKLSTLKKLLYLIIVNLIWPIDNTIC